MVPGPFHGSKNGVKTIFTVVKDPQAVSGSKKGMGIVHQQLD